MAASICCLKHVGHSVKQSTNFILASVGPDRSDGMDDGFARKSAGTRDVEITGNQESIRPDVRITLILDLIAACSNRITSSGYDTTHRNPIGFKAVSG